MKHGHWRCGLNKWKGQKLQFSDRHFKFTTEFWQIDSHKFPTEKIINLRVLKTLIFPYIFLGCQSQILHFLTKFQQGEDFFQRISDSLKFRATSCTLMTLLQECSHCLQQESHSINTSTIICLGSTLTWDNDCSVEIKNRIKKATGAYPNFNVIWNDRNITVEQKIQLLDACVFFSILLYASDTRTLKKSDEKRLAAFEMRCYRRLIRIRERAGLSDKWIHQKPTQSPIHHCGQSQASQASCLVTFAACRTVKETAVRDGGRSQLPGTTKEALSWRYTEVVQHDTTRGVTPCTGSCEVENFHSWPLRLLNHGTKRRRKLLQNNRNLHNPRQLSGHFPISW